MKNSLRSVSLFLALVLISLLASSTQTSAEETTVEEAIKPVKTFQVYHSLGQTRPFVPRGTIKFTVEKEGLVSTIENDHSCLGGSALEEMDALVSEGGYYRIKIVDEEGNGSGGSVMASVPGCEVRRSNFREDIGLSMSQTGSLLSVSYIPLVSPLAAECHELEPMATSNREYKFKTNISYTTSTPGMTLPKILPKMHPPHGFNAIKINRSAPSKTATAEGGGNTNNNEQNYGGANRFHAEEDEERRNQEEHQSFLRKYWYIILPLSIFTFLGSDEETTKRMEQMQQQQQQQPQQGQSGGNATAVGTNAKSGNAPKQRRGKRG